MHSARCVCYPWHRSHGWIEWDTGGERNQQQQKQQQSKNGYHKQMVYCDSKYLLCWQYRLRWLLWWWRWQMRCIPTLWPSIMRPSKGLQLIFFFRRIIPLHSVIFVNFKLSLRRISAICLVSNCIYRFISNTNKSHISITWKSGQLCYFFLFGLKRCISWVDSSRFRAIVCSGIEIILITRLRFTSSSDSIQNSRSNAFFREK